MLASTSIGERHATYVRHRNAQYKAVHINLFMSAYHFDTQCASSMTTVTIPGRGDICATISLHTSVSDCDNFSDPYCGIYLNVHDQGCISMAVPGAMVLMDNYDDHFWCSEKQTVLFSCHILHSSQKLVTHTGSAAVLIPQFLRLAIGSIIMIETQASSCY